MIGVATHLLRRDKVSRESPIHAEQAFGCGKGMAPRTPQTDRPGAKSEVVTMSGVFDKNVFSFF
jgi:hypothetical protein